MELLKTVLPALLLYIHILQLVISAHHLCNIISQHDQKYCKIDKGFCKLTFLVLFS